MCQALCEVSVITMQYAMLQYSGGGQASLRYLPLSSPDRIFWASPSS